MTSISDNSIPSEVSEPNSTVQATGGEGVQIKYPLKKSSDVLTEAKVAADFVVELQADYGKYVGLRKTANTALYEFLELVFLVVARLKLVSFKFATVEQKLLFTTFDEHLMQHQIDDEIDFTVATPLETKVLRFICRDLSKSREKAWTRVLKIALKNEEILTKKISFAAWLAQEGGVYEVANTTKLGVKPSNRNESPIESALTFVESWMDTDKHEHIQGDLDRSLKELPEELHAFSITLNHHGEGDSMQTVVQVRDAISINRVLTLLGKAIGEPISDRAEVEAEDAERRKKFEIETGFKSESGRD